MVAQTSIYCRCVRVKYDVEKEIKKFEGYYDVSKYESDTAMAVLMIQKNKQFIKNEIRGCYIERRHENALNLIYNAYPNCDSKVVNRELFKIGIFSNGMMCTIATFASAFSVITIPVMINYIFGSASLTVLSVVVLVITNTILHICLIGDVWDDIT